MPPVDFKALFEASPNAYMLLDRELRYVAANAAYLRETASRLEDLLGRRILDVFPHDPADPVNESATRLRNSLERVIHTGEPDVLALIRYRVPQLVDGRVEVEDRYWSATHTPIKNEHGAVVYVLQHTVDVTELQRLREAAPPGSAAANQAEAGVLRRASEVQETNVTLDTERRRLRQLFEQAPGFMCFLRGPDHVFEIANAAYDQLVGHREILGKTIRDALPEVAEQGYFELLHRVFTTGEAYVGRGMPVFVQEHPGAPLTQKFVDFSYQPISDASGAVAGILALGYDVTMQKRQEAELGELLERERTAHVEAATAWERQRFLAESIPQQVWTATPDGDLDFVNGRVTDYFGLPASDVLGTRWQAFVHPDDLPRTLDEWRRSLQTGKEYEVEFRLRGADQTWRWHLGRAVALRGADGRIEKWFGTNTDMHDLTRAREELQARAELDRQLIGIVSHDLRNPLNAIGIATALLLAQGGLDPRSLEIVRRIKSSSDRAVRLIRDFLDFTQARVSGRIPVSPREADLHAIARQAFEEVHMAYPARETIVEHHGDGAGVWDADRIAQLIGNLVSNAFQHSPPAGAVRVTTRGTDEEAIIEVQNEGSVIPPEHMRRLFEPFERGTDVRNEGTRSIGLGLFIAARIVVAHGGTIDVRSTAEEGTRFTVRLPRRASTAAVADTLAG
ncbi:MAG: PAS domain-containing sensor histidine kinase [Vicinamibacterales bacterium]